MIMMIVGVGVIFQQKQVSYSYATLTIYGKQEKPIQYSIENQDKIDLLIKTMNTSIHSQNLQKNYEKIKGITYQIKLGDHQIYTINGNCIIKDEKAYLLENGKDIFNIFYE